MRFIGGKLSKNAGGVKVDTPSGSLAIRGGIFQGIVNGRNQAVFAFVFGKYLALNRGGRRYTLRENGNLFAIGNAGPPIIRPTTAADKNLLLAAISGRNGAAKTYKTKGNAWPFYCGIQPTGRYPDQPFIREQFFNGANPIKLHRVPEPNIRVPDTPRVVETPRPEPLASRKARQSPQIIYPVLTDPTVDPLPSCVSSAQIPDEEARGFVWVGLVCEVCRPS